MSIQNSTTWGSNVLHLQPAAASRTQVPTGSPSLQNQGFAKVWTTKIVENMVFLATVAFVIAVQVKLTGEALGRW